VSHPRQWPAPWVFSLLILPLGLVIGFNFTALPFFLSRAGVPVDQIAQVNSISNLPGVVGLVIAPIVDIKLRAGPQSQLDQNHRHASRKAGQALVPNRRCLVVSHAGQQLLRVVLVRDPRGRRHDDCFFSLDLTLTATQILELFSQRWPLEVCFRDVKQFLGFEDPQNRVAPATTRTAPLIFYSIYTIWSYSGTRRRDTD
jgi:hypothetical protein